MSNFTEFGIFLSLLDGKPHKASELADQLEISTKTVYRQINKLAYAGFPITTSTGKNGGISIAGKFLCDTWFFTEVELAYLLNLINSSHNINPRLSSILSGKIKEHILSKDLSMANSLTGKLFIDTLPWFNTSSTSLSNYKTLLDACNNNTKIEITYYPSPLKRIIDPYCIVYKESNYYLYAFCNNKQQFRLFKLNKITYLNITNIQFLRKDINLNNRPWNNSKFNMVDVYLKCNKQTILDISSWAKVEDADNDTYKVVAVNNNGLIHKFMEYGNNIKILKPKSIVESLCNECKNLLNHYAN